jgi:MerR family mercuric resistance operon transcriptional regulator
MGDRELTIGSLARASGVNVETIRYYQRLGLLRQPDKPPGGTRHYAETDVARVGFIKSAQRLGFTLEEIRQLLRLEDGAHCAEAREIAEQKRLAVQEKIGELQRIEAALSGLVDACAAGPERVSCPLIAALKGAAQAG